MNNPSSAPAFPTNLSERLEDGVLSLDGVPRGTLISWSRQASRQCDKDALGCAILYSARKEAV